MSPSLSHAQATTFRIGAAFLVVAAVVLAVVALRVDASGPGDPELVDDPTSIELPRLGLFGGEVTVYGDAERPGLPARDLGCALVSRHGSELSSAKLSDLAALRQDPVVVAGSELVPLFVVRGYPSGASLECDRAESAEPLAVSGPTAFGGNAGLVRGVAAGSAVLCLLVAAVGLVLARGATRPGSVAGPRRSRRPRG